jgi:hypothetical protein
VRIEPSHRVSALVLHHVICVFHAPRTELSIELDHRQPIDLAVVIEQTLCLLVGRLGLGLRHAGCQQDQQRNAPIHWGQHPLCKVESTLHELGVPRHRWAPLLI